LSGGSSIFYYFYFFYSIAFKERYGGIGYALAAHYDRYRGGAGHGRRACYTAEGIIDGDKLVRCEDSTANTHYAL